MHFIVIFGFVQQLIHFIAGIRLVLSFVGLSFDRIVFEVDFEPKTVVEVELQSHSADMLLWLALSLLLGLFLVFALKINEVSVDVGLGEVLMCALLLDELVDVGFVYLLCPTSFALESSAPVWLFLIEILYLSGLLWKHIARLCRVILGFIG